MVWLVPSDAILSQTLAALRNTAHPYRQKLDVAFGGRVEIYTKEQLMTATRFNISATSPLTIYRSGQAMSGPNYQKYMHQILKTYNGSSRSKSLPIKQ